MRFARSEGEAHDDLGHVTGLDSVYLAIDRPEVPQAFCYVMLCDLGSPPDDATLQEFVDRIVSRLDAHMVMHRRFRPTPLGRGRWVFSPIDRAKQVRVVRPAGRLDSERLNGQLARHMNRPLTRRLPLWDLEVHAPTDDATVAVVFRFHHSSIDGGYLMEITKSICDGESAASDWTPPTEFSSDAEHQRYDRAASLNAKAVAAARLPRYLASTLQSRQARRAVAATSQSQIPPVERSRTPWARKPSSGRYQVSRSELPLEQFNQLRTELGVSFNDLLVGLAAGAYRRYLLHAGVLPSRPLTVGCPVSTRSRHEAHVAHNRVADYNAVLPVHLSDPLARVRGTQTAQEHAKAWFYAGDPRGQERLGTYVPSRLVAAGVSWYQRLQIARLHEPVFDLFLTSLPFPTSATTLAGRPITWVGIVPPLSQVVHVDLVAVTTPTSITLTLASDPSSVNEPERILQGFVDELSVLAESIRHPNSSADRRTHD